MSQWPKQNEAAMNAFYGDPDRNNDGACDPSWEAANIVKIVPPYKLWYPTEDQNRKIIKRAKAFTGLRVHKKCAASLMTCLTGIKESFTPEEIVKYELDLCGGVHVFRLMRGGSALSMHSWGSAIDLSHLINYFKRKYDPAKNMMPMKAVEIFRAEGWTWGGLWRTGDAMHFQAADL
jgi:hypothetical protein